MIDTNELRQLVQAATPGPWEISEDHRFPGVHAWGEVVFGGSFCDYIEPIKADQAFIAAANPAVISELLDRLEAAEKERELDEQRIADLMADLNRVGHENDTLRAKAAERERQEPVAEWIENRFDQYPQLVWNEKYRATIGAKLYALPGAQTQGEGK